MRQVRGLTLCVRSEPIFLDYLQLLGIPLLFLSTLSEIPMAPTQYARLAWHLASWLHPNARHASGTVSEYLP